MANNAVTTSQIPVTNTSLATTDRVLVVKYTNGVPATRTTPLEHLYSNSSVNSSIKILATPANSTNGGVAMKPGTMFTDGTYLYIATSTSQLKRVLIENWA
jgi:hypothetical protein